MASHAVRSEPARADNLIRDALSSLMSKRGGESFYGPLRAFLGDDPSGIDAGLAKASCILDAFGVGVGAKQRKRMLVALHREGARVHFRHGRPEDALVLERRIGHVEGVVPRFGPELVDLRHATELAEAGGRRFSRHGEGGALPHRPPTFAHLGEVGPATDLELPAPVVLELPQAQISACEDAVIVDRHVVLHDAARLGPIERWSFWDYVEAGPGRALHWQPDRHTPARIPEGFALTGGTSQNYYHFVIEYLTRIALLEETDLASPSTPILASKEALAIPQLAAILRRAVGPARPIRGLDKAFFQVDRLLVASARCMMPHELRPGETFRMDDHWIDPAPIRWLAERIRSPRTGASPRRLFLRRGESVSRRKLVNESALLALAVARGFEPVFPGSLTLDEQADLFGGAEAIAGSSGAAFANALFMPEGAKQICLLSRPWEIGLYQAVADALDHRIMHVAGEHHPGTGTSDLQDDFEVDPAHFVEALDALDL